MNTHIHTHIQAKDEAAAVRKAELAQEKKVQEERAEAEDRKNRVHKPGKSVEETRSFLHKPVMPVAPSTLQVRRPRRSKAITLFIDIWMVIWVI